MKSSAQPMPSICLLVRRNLCAATVIIDPSRHRNPVQSTAELHAGSLLRSESLASGDMFGRFDTLKCL